MFPCRPCSRWLRSFEDVSSFSETCGSEPGPFGLRWSGGTGGSLLISNLLWMIQCGNQTLVPTCWLEGTTVPPGPEHLRETAGTLPGLRRYGPQGALDEYQSKHGFKYAKFEYAKDPDDWVSGDEPMTGAQASYLKT